MTRLLVATTNPGKLREVAAALEGMPFEVVSLSEYPDLPEVEETGATFLENAIIKARAYAARTGLLTLADDSGLEVDALDGAPGVFSSRFAPSDTERIARLLALLDGVPPERRAAKFTCAIAIASPDGKVETCEESVDGVIAEEPSGVGGFGYDPVIYVLGLGKTMAELSLEEKNRISHRGKALRAAREILARHGAAGLTWT